MVELNPLAVKYGRYMKISFVISLILFTLAGLFMLEDALAQGQGGPPKVDIFAKQSGNSILVTWENPDDTADDIKFKYTVSRDVNRTENFVPIFNSQRDIEQKIIDEENGQEMFFYLDNDIKGGSDYTYQIGTGRPQGNPNPNHSDDTRPIFIQTKSIRISATSEGHLIVSGDPLPPITPVVSWIDWFPFQLAQADSFTNPIFTTSVNPQIESFRLALEPLPNPNDNDICDEILEVIYTKNQEKGQDFNILTTIFEITTVTDDDTGVEVSTEVEVLQYQKLWTNFTDSIKFKQKWLVVHPENQTIGNYTNLEIQFDITGKPINPLEHRSISFWKTYYTIPLGNNAC